METPKEFLNPSSMLTPGIAGAVAMTIANTLNAQFGFNAAVVALQTELERFAGAETGGNRGLGTDARIEHDLHDLDRSASDMEPFI